METKAEILYETEKSYKESAVYFNLDDSLINEIKVILKKEHSEDVVINITKEDITILKNELDLAKIELNKHEDVKVDFLSNLICISYVTFKMYEAIAKTKGKIEFTDETKVDKSFFENKANLKDILHNYLGLYTSNYYGTDYQLKCEELDGELDLMELHNVLKKSNFTIHIFGIENITSKDYTKIQENLNTIIAWRSLKTKLKLYTSEKGLITYNAIDKYPILRGHDYTSIEYEGSKILTKKK